jgi:hypothetical protein
MKITAFLALASFFVGLGFTSCADKTEPKPVGPTSSTSNMPWNSPVAGQGQGQFGAMPQNQYRR